MTNWVKINKRLDDIIKQLDDGIGKEFHSRDERCVLAARLIDAATFFTSKLAAEQEAKQCLNHSV